MDAHSIADIRLVASFLPERLAKDAFSRVLAEVEFDTAQTHHGGPLPRLSTTQAVFEGTDIPLYRFPSDEIPIPKAMTKSVDAIRLEAEKLSPFPLNHCLIQLYRNGEDHISEHADKTLDIVPGSVIVNISFGSSRVMTLRNKKKVANGQVRQLHRYELLDNSAFLLPLEANRYYVHGIRPDRTGAFNTNEADKQRLSLTFRSIHTFISSDGKSIRGGGATSADRYSNIIRNAEKWAGVIQAFGRENQEAGTWRDFYSDGSDVLPLLLSG